MLDRRQLAWGLVLVAIICAGIGWTWWVDAEDAARLSGEPDHTSSLVMFGAAGVAILSAAVVYSGRD